MKKTEKNIGRQKSLPDMICLESARRNCGHFLVPSYLRNNKSCNSSIILQKGIFQRNSME